MPAASSDRADVLGLRALRTLGDVVLDPLAVLEAAVAGGLDGGLVDEDIRRAIVGGDEPITAFGVEPLHCSLSHCALLPRRSSGSGVHPGRWRPPAFSSLIAGVAGPGSWPGGVRRIPAQSG